MRALIFRAVILGPLRQNLLRTGLSIAAIALGTALGVAVNVINASAAAEFARAERALSGAAHVMIRGAAFEEALYPRIARMPQVEVASPAIELEVKVSGQRDLVTVFGIDPLRAASLQQNLSTGRKERNLLEPDTVIVSDDVARRLDLKIGDSLVVQVESGSRRFEVIDILLQATGARNLALMDIANAQWRLGILGKINRIDVKLTEPALLKDFREAIDLPAGVDAVLPEEESDRSSEVSRAYRVNLNMLSLVALFTGSFLVFSTQALSIIQRRRPLAVVRVLGLPARTLTSLVLGEAVIVGALGAAVGVGVGVALARTALHALGPDLGDRYFDASIGALDIEPATLAIFFVLGIAAAVAGAFFPALAVQRIAPAQALASGDPKEGQPRSRLILGAVILGAAIVASFAPPVFGLPLFGYAAIALILIGAFIVTPALLRSLLVRIPRPRAAFAALALSRLRANPGETTLSIFAIVAAFSVMVAMAIMVDSFRRSLHDWLLDVLPADVYVRARGDSGFLSESKQHEIAAIPGVERARFLRYQEISLGDSALTLIAREDPHELPAVGERLAPGSRSVWVSEAAADLYAWKLGSTIELPIAGKSETFTVAGFWRDYARQTGAVAIERELYIQLSGDDRVNDAAIWLAPATDASAVIDSIREVVGSELDIVRSGELYARSLQAFDQTFAVTYVLEAVAVLVGLFGVSAGFSARVLARRGELGVLRYLGASQRDIMAMLGFEGAASTFAGMLLGLLLGVGLSIILIFVVNRQSFHWSMEMHVPALAIAGLSAMMVLAATATAILSARKAATDETLRAVREDW